MTNGILNASIKDPGDAWQRPGAWTIPWKGTDVTEATPSEIWRTAPGYPDYTVSDQGRVRSHKRNRTLLMKQSLNERGYRHLSMSNSGVRDTVKVHVLVALAFHGERPDGLQIRHLNGDKLDNRAANLAYGTASENSQDSILHGVHPSARRTHCPRGHEYTPENTYVDRKSSRSCRACARIDQQARRDKLPPAFPRTRCSNGHEFTPENTYTPPGGSPHWRRCRTCEQAYRNRRQAG